MDSRRPRIPKIERENKFSLYQLETERCQSNSQTAVNNRDIYSSSYVFQTQPLEGESSKSRSLGQQQQLSISRTELRDPREPPGRSGVPEATFHTVRPRPPHRYPAVCIERHGVHRDQGEPIRR